ncbi:MAG: hypothetical protein EBX36_12410, partial [Planctomycetia bacterium]|nr:hypothetical protein [Planctomycetia bacterium]
KTYESKNGWAYGFDYDRAYRLPTSISLTMTASVSASHPIAIGFQSAGEGHVSLMSQGGVVVGGRLRASTLAIDSERGIDLVPGRGTLDAGSIVLHAGLTIGDAATPLVATVDRITAEAGGDVALALNADTTRAVSIASIVAGAGGTATVVAGGSIVASADSKGVRGAAVSMTSLSGSVGSTAVPIFVDRTFAAGREATTKLRLDVNAAGGVAVRAGGDVLVGVVSAAGGDSFIDAAGSVYDARSWTLDAARDAEITRALQEIGALDPEARIKSGVDFFQETVRGHYARYWQLRGDGVVFGGRLQLRDTALDRWAQLTRLDLAQHGTPVDTPSTQQILDYAARLFADEEAYFTATIGATWRDDAAFQAYDPDWRYTATDDQVKAITVQLGLTTIDLVTRLNSATTKLHIMPFDLYLGMAA